MQAGLPLPIQTGMQIRQPGIGSMQGQQPTPAIVLPLRPNEQPFAPIGSPAPFIPVDEELFTAADLNPADSGETAGSGKPVPANGTTAEHVAVSGDGSVPDENTTPVLSYGSGATTGGSVIGQWASRFRKATPKT